MQQARLLWRLQLTAGTLDRGAEIVSTPTKATIVDDRSNSYETVASEFAERREQSSIGVATVRAWARSLPSGASILDLGCGHGMPISMALMNDGFVIYGVDSSPSLTAAFRRQFPHAHVAFRAVEDSHFFGRTFDGIIAVGLIFLLPSEVQRDLIQKGRADVEPRRPIPVHVPDTGVHVDGRVDGPSVAVTGI